MTTKEAKLMAQFIAQEVGAVKGTGLVAEWSSGPAVSLTVHLDKSEFGKRYVVHKILSEPDALLRLIKGDGRTHNFIEQRVGRVIFDRDKIAALIQAHRMLKFKPGYEV